MEQSTRLAQFNARYDAIQDRILLRIRAADDTEFRFWITRRYLSLLWPILMKMADDFYSRKAPNDPLTRSALAEMAHGEAVNQADFSSDYKDGSVFPLGEEPVLLAKISVHPPVGNTQTLMLLPNHGQGINLNLDEKLVHILARLFQQTAIAAEWMLKLDVSPGVATSVGNLEPNGPRLLH